MTEEDTFDALRKKTLAEIEFIWDTNDNVRLAWIEKSPINQAWCAYLTHYGYTMEDWHSACDARGGAVLSIELL